MRLAASGFTGIGSNVEGISKTYVEGGSTMECRRTMKANHSVKVESISEFKDALDAAETLGLDVVDVDAARYGWESPDADAIHPKGNFEIEKVGRKYVHFDFGSEGVARAEFGTDYDGDAAYIRLHFA